MSNPRPDPRLPTPIAPAERPLIAAEFHRLAEVSPELEWFANIRNRSTGAPTRTRSGILCNLGALITG